MIFPQGHDKSAIVVTNPDSEAVSTHSRHESVRDGKTPFSNVIVNYIWLNLKILYLVMLLFAEVRGICWVFKSDSAHYSHIKKEMYPMC